MKTLTAVILNAKIWKTMPPAANDIVRAIKPFVSLIALLGYCKKKRQGYIAHQV